MLSLQETLTPVTYTGPKTYVLPHGILMLEAWNLENYTSVLSLGLPTYIWCDCSNRALAVAIWNPKTTPSKWRFCCRSCYWQNVRWKFYTKAGMWRSGSIVEEITWCSTNYWNRKWPHLWYNHQIYITISFLTIFWCLSALWRSRYTSLPWSPHWTWAVSYWSTVYVPGFSCCSRGF